MNTEQHALRMNIHDLESRDLPSLFELALSNLGYSGKQILYYTLLVEEALLKWEKAVQSTGELEFRRIDSRRNVKFQFLLPGNACDPFEMEETDTESVEYVMQNSRDRLLAGIGSELKYRFKKTGSEGQGVNCLNLTLPKKNIERSLFRNRLFLLMIPLILQCLLDNLSTGIDSLMLGFVDPVALASIALAGSFKLVHTLALSAILSAETILLSQLWGKRDRGSCWSILKLSAGIGLLISVLMVFVSMFFSETILRFYAADPALIRTGALYLRCVSWSYLFIALYRSYLCFMKVTDAVKMTILFSLVSCICNVLVNAIVIYGLFGVPRMGAAGAAYSTVFSSFVLLVMVAVYHMKKGRSFLIPGDSSGSSMTASMVRDLFSKTGAVASQMGVYLLGSNIIASAFGHMGSDVVAANAFIGTVSGLFLTMKDGMGGAAGILIGSLLGRNEKDRAWNAMKEAYRVCCVIGLAAVSGLLIAGIAAQSGGLSLTEKSLFYMRYLLAACCLDSFFCFINAVSINGCLFAGGDTKGVLIADAVTMFGILIPAALVSIYTDFLPLIPAMLLLRCSEVISSPIKFLFVLRKKWLRNLT